MCIRDRIQAVILIVGSVILTGACFANGGFDYLASLFESGDMSVRLIRPLTDTATPWLGLIVGMPVLGIYFWANNQTLVQRVLSARSVDEGRKGVMFAGALTLATLFIIVFPGVIARHLFPGIEKPDMIYPTMVLRLLPTGLLGIMLSALLAALTSTSVSYTHLDVYKRQKHHWHRFGSSGKILIPLDLKILDEEGREVPRGQKGEIVVRGENVMAGYWKNPEATAETVRDGWLHTGDMGYVSEDDFLYVLGRFKSLLIASDGEKYSPEGMEEAIVDKSPYIDQIIVHNNQSPFTGAIVVPNREALRRELEARRTPEAERANVAAEILGAEIDRYRAGGTYAGEFPERWLPAGLAIVDEAFTEQNGLVNSTMKVVRGKVEEHFRNRLDYLYSAEGRSLKNPENLASLKKIVG